MYARYCHLATATATSLLPPRMVMMIFYPHPNLPSEDICDSSNGIIKVALTAAQEEYGEGGQVPDLNSASDAYEYLTEKWGKGDVTWDGWKMVNQELTEKKMRASTARSGNRGGLYRYRVAYIGPKAVIRRRVKDCKAAKTAKGKGVIATHHSFATAARNGSSISARILSCHSCTSCKSFDILGRGLCVDDKLPKSELVKMVELSSSNTQGDDAGRRSRIKKEGKAMARLIEVCGCRDPAR